MSEEEPEFGEPEFLGWHLLRELKNQSDDQISRSKFLKLCCVADRNLLETHEYDVGLARYWYMYGELTNEHEFSGRFYNAPQAMGWDGQQYIPKSLDIEAFDVSKEGFELITDSVEWTVREFGRENVEAIKQHQYEEHAENSFIQEYSELRWLLSTIDLGSQQRLENFTEGGTKETVESNEEYLRQKLDTMVGAYPEDEGRHEEMKALYLRWDDTVRLMLDQSVQYSRIAEFLDDFIFALSRVVLRFDYSQHISDSRLADWEEDAADVKSDFTNNVQETRRELLGNRSRSTELDGVSRAYSRTIEEQIERLRSH
ncbi:hypothetical protein HTG_18045 [Natrinema mahii]|nr:hypothetical protein HTG_18045 [Natrinema mahii]